jgi:cardiolipin synthase
VAWSLPPFIAGVAIVLSALAQATPSCSGFSAIASTDCCEGATPPLLISEFYAKAVAGDEYVRILSEADVDVPLRGWRLTDGEGAIEFSCPCTISPGQEVAVSFNSSSYVAAYGVPPDFHVDASGQETDLELTGSFRLADSGDSIAFVDPLGVEADRVVYGDATSDSPTWIGSSIPAPRSGEVVKRRVEGERAVDTNTASDWQPFREFRYGYTEHIPKAFDILPNDLRAFVSPDCSLEVVLDRVASAESEILLCSYEIQSPSLCSHLLDALDRGVSVEILVDGSPVGGMSVAEVAALSALTTAGADARVMSGTLREGVVRHSSALHSKYMVIDAEEAIVLSENFVRDGLPVDRIFGNRGWGIAVRSPELAEHLANVFRCDSRCDRPDISRWVEDERFDPRLSAPVAEGSRHLQGCLPPLVCSSGATVTLHVSPDSSTDRPFLCDLMGHANDIVVQQLQADMMWDTRWSESDVMSPLLSKLLDRLRDGASCRMLLDSSWYNIVRNEGVMTAMTAVACADGLDGTFRMLSERSPISLLHNKGVVLDGEVTVVSSNNWVYASFARNRELAVVVESDEAGEYFSTAFCLDWSPDDAPPVAELESDVVAACGERVLLSSAMCRDDRLIADYLWDIGVDGEVDCRGPELSFVATVPGTVDVSLTVIDTWGNSATATATVRVVADDLPVRDDEAQSWDRAAAAIPIVLGASLLIAKLIRSRGSDKGA